MSKYWICAFATLLFSACGAPPAPVQVQETSEVISENTSIGQPIEMGQSMSIISENMGGSREINIWTPPSYGEDEERRYPVLYVIDGGKEQDFHHISGLAQLAAINGMYEEMIVVGIKTENRLMELAHEPKDPRYIRTPANAGKSDVFLEFITQEVIPYVEEQYSVSQRRLVVGESLAGLFVVEVFLKSPDSFSDYISVSPSLWWDDKALAKSAVDLLAHHDETPRKLYLTMADEGGTMQTGLDMIIAAIKNDKPEGLDWFYVDRRDSEHHSTIYHGAVLDALRKMAGIPVPDYGPDPWYLIEGGQPPEE
jgi:predicted alpha/beta superfamily hydrolase